MQGRLNSVREVEDELRVRAGGRSRSLAVGRSWEFKGLRGGVSGALRRAGRRSAGRERPPDGARQQRVIVKASFTVHKAARGRGALAAHVRYLGRDSASLDGQPGRFYDATRDAVDARAAVAEWEQDRHHFRFIVSPERADLLDRQPGGLAGYIREWVARAERDLGTRLEWVAVNHHNTDDLHTHVLVRGRRTCGQQDDGRDLVIPRQHLSHGLREAAQEIATRRLGPRTADQVRDAAEREVSAERYTSLDATIERQLDGGRRLRLRAVGAMADPDCRRRVAARLHHLEKFGLASRDRHGRWTVPAELKPRLRALSERGDIIKNLHATLGRASAAVASYRGDRELAGHVAAIGTHDELRGSRYVVVRDLDGGQLHYVRAANATALRGLEVGGIVRASGTDPRRARMDATIAQVARANGGVYTAEAHHAHLPPSRLPADHDRLIAAHARRLAALERAGSAVRTSAGWTFRDLDALAGGRHACGRAGEGFIEVVSARSVQGQIEAQAWTWLDRQMHRLTQGKPAALPFDTTLTAAASERRQWMVRHGYAAVVGDRYQLRPRAAGELRQREWQAVAQQQQARHGRTITPLPPGVEVHGQYRGTLTLHDGPHAIVSSGERTYFVPVNRPPTAQRGSSVVARATVASRALVQAVPPREAKPLERE